MGRYRVQHRRYIASDIGGGGYAAMAAMWATGSYIKAVLFADAHKSMEERAHVVVSGEEEVNECLIAHASGPV
jgi:hypothetical protein